MQTLANIGQFEQLQVAANAAMGCSGLGVFNDSAIENGSGGRQSLARKARSALLREVREDDPNKRAAMSAESDRLTGRLSDRVEDGQRREEEKRVQLVEEAFDQSMDEESLYGKGAI